MQKRLTLAKRELILAKKQPILAKRELDCKNNSLEIFIAHLSMYALTVLHLLTTASTAAATTNYDQNSHNAFQHMFPNISPRRIFLAWSRGANP